jgi:hypothetical protein
LTVKHFLFYGTNTQNNPNNIQHSKDKCSNENKHDQEQEYEEERMHACEQEQEKE